MSTPNKTIVIDPNFLKLPMKGGRTRKTIEKTDLCQNQSKFGQRKNLNQTKQLNDGH
jgi:hypothetical protein